MMRKGRNNYTKWKRSAWARAYRERMEAGLEYCRRCRNPRNNRILTFAHLISKADRGTGCFDNISILCEPCNQEQGTAVWASLVSLAEEERQAEPGRRWGWMAQLRKRAMNCDRTLWVDPHDDLTLFDLDVHD